MHEDSTIKEKKVYQYTCNQLCKEMQLTKFKQILEKKLSEAWVLAVTSSPT
ncbi:hypothetical protein GGF49_004085 [Coemansia sp. RSA 1853]|nr:hypothetical protein GGF49_004085 [Coemansia sp. RSA 1853]